jgi:mevalonate kinase
MTKQYAAKLLLLGEYTVVKGSRAIATPIKNYSGHWVTHSNQPALQQNLVAFSNHIDQLQQQEELHRQLDVSAFQELLDQGGYFDSNIPTGYGVGSSGALCAAVYDAFGVGERPEDLTAVKIDLAVLERFFHGESSGTDPLISLLDQPVLIDAQKGTQTIDVTLPLEGYYFFLIDTGISRKTGPLVQHFLAQCESTTFVEHLQQELIPATDQAIDALVAQNGSTLFEAVQTISQFQFDHFQDMIPDTFNDIWKAGLDSDYFKIKLCGAGGGGFLLGLTHDLERLQSNLDRKSIVVPVF